VIKNVNRIRLIRLSKKLFSFKSLLSFLIFNPGILIFLFLRILVARFPLFILFKYYMQLLRRERRLIRKRGNITEIIYRSDIFIRIAA
jgi:hypothetical protein